jgi:hypothetical protein
MTVPSGQGAFQIKLLLFATGQLNWKNAPNELKKRRLQARSVSELRCFLILSHRVWLQCGASFMSRNTSTKTNKLG